MRRTVDLETLRRWAWLLDSRFRVPGTRIRFGLDAIVGLIPGLGDLTSPAFGVLVLVSAFRLRVPAIVQARMVLNTVLDVLLGLVPVAGDLVDVAWKANVRNLGLLERHARPGVAPTRGDYVFVILWVGLVVAIALLPILLLLWLLAYVPLM